ncbi:MAG: DUF2190 family protein [Rhodocyclaceae bacterium]|nr:DUF2190 family protein [Rhodocyclaceae bacterium]
MSNQGIVKNYNAEAAISAYRIVKHGTADSGVVAAAAATDALIGVTQELGPASGERCDVQMTGIAYVEAGAAITHGVFVTSDSVGRGVAAAPAAGVNNSVIGRALEAASAAGDVIRVLLANGTLQG